jgi:hypothetical protein
MYEARALEKHHVKEVEHNIRREANESDLITVGHRSEPAPAAEENEDKESQDHKDATVETPLLKELECSGVEISKSASSLAKGCSVLKENMIPQSESQQGSLLPPQMESYQLSTSISKENSPLKEDTAQ